MATDPRNVQQAVSRALRDNLDRVQRTAEELREAVGDLVAACGSSRPSNALPSMLRAQTAAASLAATLEVLARFVTAALQPGQRGPAEQEVLRLVSIPAREPSPAPPPKIPTPMAGTAPSAPPAEAVPPEVLQEADMLAEGAPVTPMAEAEPSVPPEVLQETDMLAEGAPVTPMAEAEPSVPPAEAVPPEVLQETDTLAEGAPVTPMAEAEPSLPPAEAAPPEVLQEADMLAEGAPVIPPEMAVEPVEPAAKPNARVEQAPGFDLASLSAEERELHRRANRVAKVSMQDIKMLRPEDVRLGREHKDLCVRLRDDIEKAHKEYERRFRPILAHPTDYFYQWMVEILADGNPEALGEYPYSSRVLRR